MPEIPISVIDNNTWNILPGKINTKEPPDKSHHLLILLLRKGIMELSDQIMSNYILNYKEYIKSLFKQNNTMSHISFNIKLAIYEYIGYQKKKKAITIMKHFNIRFNYTIFRCSIKADNYALVDLLVRRGYPRNIKKHNDEIYHILNDMLNMTIMSESTFEILIDNILTAYKQAKISLYTYIRILKKGYYRICKKIKPFIDENIWNGSELKFEINDLRDNWNHLYKHMIENFHLEVIHKR